MTQHQKRIAALGAAGLVVLLIAATLFWPAGQGDLVCRHVNLQDSVTGLVVAGIEDIALDPTAPRVVLSAYDRHSDEAGGLYGVDIDALSATTDRLIAAPRLAPAPGGPPLRPHGFAIGPAGADGKSAPLAVIARTRRTEGGYDAKILYFSLSKDGLAPAGVPVSAEALCNANDLAGLDGAGGWLVTSDRKDCGSFARFMEDVLGQHNGSVRIVREQNLNIVASQIAFANGIALDAGHVYVAATRGKTLLVFDRAALEAGRQTLLQSWPLKAAPDNLSFGADGALYIAAHEDLLRYAAFRSGWRGTSRSIIFRFDPASASAPQKIGTVGGGDGIEGATVALQTGAHLVIGSAFDRGLALCDLPGGKTS